MTNKEPLKVFIGFDPREAVVYHTCVQSIIENTRSPVAIHPLHLDMFDDYKEQHKDGSNAFIYSRFLVPYLCNFRGKALFIDGDMIINKDLNELFNLFDKNFAAQVVKHEYKTKYQIKYLGSRNDDYPKKIGVLLYYLTVNIKKIKFYNHLLLKMQKVVICIDLVG